MNSYSACWDEDAFGIYLWAAWEVHEQIGIELRREIRLGDFKKMHWIMTAAMEMDRPIQGETVEDKVNLVTHI